MDQSRTFSIPQLLIIGRGTLRLEQAALQLLWPRHLQICAVCYFQNLGQPTPYILNTIMPNQYKDPQKGKPFSGNSRKGSERERMYGLISMVISPHCCMHAESALANFPKDLRPLETYTPLTTREIFTSSVISLSTLHSELDSSKLCFQGSGRGNRSAIATRDTVGIMVAIHSLTAPQP